MVQLFKDGIDNQKICLRRISGAICIISGILIMFIKIIYFMATETMIPLDGRGQFLVASGAALLGITSFDGLLRGKDKNE